MHFRENFGLVVDKSRLELGQEWRGAIASVFALSALTSCSMVQNNGRTWFFLRCGLRSVAGFE